VDKQEQTWHEFTDIGWAPVRIVMKTFQSDHRLLAAPPPGPTQPPAAAQHAL
ncbi:unnamed protein product, partial [Prorocentrum cordatum]